MVQLLWMDILVSQVKKKEKNNKPNKKKDHDYGNIPKAVII